MNNRMAKMNRKITRIFAVLLTASIFFNSISVYAQAADGNPFSRNYPIRQEQIAQNGVLVSRPQPLDRDIFTAIRLHRIETLEQYGQWLDRNLTYREDGIFDNWSHPDDTWKKKSGDCEDYAILNLTVLSKLGFEARFMALFRNKAAHAICVVKYNGTYSWFDNAKFNRTEARTLEELGKIITDEHLYYKVGEYNTSTGAWETVFEKPQPKPKDA